MKQSMKNSDRMKHFVISLAVIMVTVWAEPICKADVPKISDKYFEVDVTKDSKGNLILEKKSKDIKGEIYKFKNEYYIFTEMNVKFSSPLVDPKIWIKPESQDCIYYYRNNDFQTIKGSNTLKKETGFSYAYINTPYPSVKFKIDDKNCYLRTPLHEDWNPKNCCITIEVDSLVTKGKAQLVSHAVKQNDTCRINSNDTLKTIIFTKSQWTRLEKIELNGKQVDTTDITFNDNPFSPYRDSLNLGNAIVVIKINKLGKELDEKNEFTITLMQLDESGKLSPMDYKYIINVDKSRSYKLLPVGKLLPGFIIFCIIVVLVCVYLLFKSTRSNKKCEIKTTEELEKEKVQPEEEKSVKENNHAEDKSDSEESKKAKDEKLRKDYEGRIEFLERKLTDKEKEIKNRDRIIAEKQVLLDENNSKIKTLNGYIADKNKRLEDVKITLDSLRQQLLEKEQILVATKRKLENRDSEYNKELVRQKVECDKMWAAREEEYLKNIDEIKDDCAKALDSIRRENAELRQIIDSSRIHIKNFYSKGIEEISKAISTIYADCDSQSSVYAIVETIAGKDAVNGFVEFRESCLSVLDSDIRIDELAGRLAEILLKDLEYEKSWCNSLIRLYAYSRVESLSDIFGYYGEYKADFSAAFENMVKMSEQIGVKDIHIPELFNDEYDSKAYDFRNTDLVLPGLFPDYVNLLTPMTIYDILKVGYTFAGKTVKATVVYYPKH